MDSGFSANGAPFEYTVSEKMTSALRLKKIALLAAYILWGVVIFVVGMMVRLIVPFLALVPLSIWIIAFFTWRYTQVDYEYSFFSGMLTVSRILGGRSRKKLTSVVIRDAAHILPYTDENVARAEAFGAKTSIFAASSHDAENLYLILWDSEETGKTMLCFEANEKAVKILRYYNIAACSKG